MSQRHPSSVSPSATCRYVHSNPNKPESSTLYRQFHWATGDGEVCVINLEDWDNDNKSSGRHTTFTLNGRRGSLAQPPLSPLLTIYWDHLDAAGYPTIHSPTLFGGNGMSPGFCTILRYRLEIEDCFRPFLSRISRPRMSQRTRWRELSDNRTWWYWARPPRSDRQQWLELYYKNPIVGSTNRVVRIDLTSPEGSGDRVEFEIRGLEEWISVRGLKEFPETEIPFLTMVVLFPVIFWAQQGRKSKSRDLRRDLRSTGVTT